MFVFYDTETTGLDQDFSQILQISLLFTDDNFNILSSKKLECRRSPWVVPAPGALLTTGFAPDDLKFGKLSNYEMMREVNAWVRGQHWPVTFIGYNSLGYDEPVLAQNLHQNLLDPGLTTAGNSVNNQVNGRADIMQVVKAAALYMPGAVKLDILNGYGKPSMSLLNVAQQNGVVFPDTEAHDSMNDIKATVAVAKFLRHAAPQVWDQLMKLTTPAGVDAFLSGHAVFTYSYAGKKASVATALADAGGGWQTLYDLSVDPMPYMSMTPEQLKDVFLSKTGPKPFLLMDKGGQPMLMPMDLSDAVLPAGYGERTYAARAKALKADPAFLGRVQQAASLARQEMTKVKGNTPEEMIGNPVDSPRKEKLERWIQDFRYAPDWRKRAELIGDFCVRFKDDLAGDPSLLRFVRFAERIVFEHAPAELGPEQQEAMKRFVAARLLDPDEKAPYMTVARARKELLEIEQERMIGNKKWQHVTDGQIRSLKLYYTALEKEYAAYAPQQRPSGSSPSAPSTGTKPPAPL